PPRVGSFVWAKDGKKESLKIIEDEGTKRDLDNPKLRPVPGRPNMMMGPGVPFKTSNSLTSEKEHLSQDPRDKTVNIWGQGRPHTREWTLFGCYRNKTCEDMVYALLAN